jgi:hypothetical protein
VAIRVLLQLGNLRFHPIEQLAPPPAGLFT